MRRIAPLLALTGVAAALLSPQGAAAHPERPSFFPAGRKGAVPAYRTTGPSRVVCQPDSRERIEALPDAAMRDENLALLEGWALPPGRRAHHRGRDEAQADQRRPLRRRARRVLQEHAAARP